MTHYRIVENNAGKFQLQQMHSSGIWQGIRFYKGRHSSVEWYGYAEAKELKTFYETLDFNNSIKRIVE